jgi:DNA-binding response OmpR family regulator
MIVFHEDGATIECVTVKPTCEVVLIVEDETYIAMAVEDTLLAAGFHPCGIAVSESDAFRLADAYKPDLAIVDINLGSGGNGLNVGRELVFRGVAVLYASGNCLSYLMEMSETGAQAYLVKPYSLADLEVAMRVLASLKRGGAVEGNIPETVCMLPH